MARIISTEIDYNNCQHSAAQNTLYKWDGEPTQTQMKATGSPAHQWAEGGTNAPDGWDERTGKPNPRRTHARLGLDYRRGAADYGNCRHRYLDGLRPVRPDLYSGGVVNNGKQS